MTDSLQDDIVFLTLSGKIMGGLEKRTQFLDKVHEHLKRKRRYFVVDMKKVPRINSMGIGMLVSAVISVRREEGRMVFANTEDLRAIFTMVNIIRIFECYDSVEEAIESLLSTAHTPDTN